MWKEYPREPIRMRERVQLLQEKPVKKKGLKWGRKEYNWVIKNKRFRIYFMQIGQERRYKLSTKENSILWNEVKAPSGSSFEVADDGKYIYFVLLIEGVRRSNIFKQSKNPS